MNVNFDVQFARMEMDMAWDEYLDDCWSTGVPTMSFAEWKKTYNQ